MYSYSPKGLGQLEDQGIDFGSGIIVIGAIALVTLLLWGTGKEPSSQGGKKKAKKKRRGYGSTRTIYKKAPASVIRIDEGVSDLKQEVIDGLVGQGATKAQATKAVRASRGNDFDTLFKNSIAKIRGLA